MVTRLCVLVLLLLSFVLLPCASSADEKTIPATGKYVMGDQDSKTDAKKIALLNAKQLALEAAGTYLTTHSQVQNYALTHDEISSLSAGVIAVKIVDEKWSMVGESPVVTITIEAVIDATGLEDRIKAVKEDQEGVQEYGQIRDELDKLKAELAQLKAREKTPEPAAEASIRESATSTEKKNAIDRLLSIAQVRDTSARLGKGKSDAIADLGRAIELNPGNYYAFFKRSQIFESQEAYAKALADIDSALELDPNAEKAHAVKGRILVKNGRLRDALEAFTKGIQANPASGLCYYGRGMTFMQMKRTRNAYGDFQKACEGGIKDACAKLRGMIRRGKASLGGEKPQPRKRQRR